MNHLTDPLIKQLKQARATKGLSQRDLSQATDLPQSYLSRIENGGIDIGLSNLVTLARALDLELKLVPKQSIPAVDSIVRSTQISELAHLLARVNQSAEQLIKINEDRAMLVKALTPLPNNMLHRMHNLDEDQDE
jgi:transcriptional regulator with XRE-family HTH domain